MSLIGQVFLELLTPKYLLFEMLRGLFSQKQFGSESVTESRRLLKSEEKYFYPTFSSF